MQYLNQGYYGQQNPPTMMQPAFYPERRVNEHMYRYPSITAGIFGAVHLLLALSLLIVIEYMISDNKALTTSLPHGCIFFFAAAGILLMVSANNRTQCTNTSAMVASILAFLSATILASTIGNAINEATSAWRDNNEWAYGMTIIAAVETLPALGSTILCFIVMCKQQKEEV